jgi:hypothetical protein
MRLTFTRIRLFMVFMSPVRNMCITTSHMLASGAIIDGFEGHIIEVR